MGIGYPFPCGEGKLIREVFKLVGAPKGIEKKNATPLKTTLELWLAPGP